MNALRLTIALTLLLMAGCPRATPQYSFKYSEKRIKVPKNGLRVMVVPDKNTDLVQVDVRYEVGSAQDPPGKAGLAHVVEHMMFQLRPDGPNTPPLFQYLPQLATFMNAFTNWDSTHYMTQGRKELLKEFMRIEAMRLFYSCESANISQEEFEREREVVRNEIRMRTGTAEGQIPQLILSAVFPETHPYQQMIGGNDKQLTNITMKDVCNFWNEYYVPSNATIIVAGNVEVDDVTALVKQYFQKIPRKKVGPKKEVEPVKLTRKEHTYELKTERSSVNVAWALPPGNTKEGQWVRFAMGRVWSDVAMRAEEWDFAYNVDAGVLGGQLAPIFVVTVELKNNSDKGKALKFIWNAAKTAHHNMEFGFEDESKAIMKASSVSSLESLTGRTVQLGDMIQFDKTIDWESNEPYFIKQLEQIDELDGERMKGAIKNTFDPKKAQVIFIKSTKTGIKGDKRSSLTFNTKTHEKKEATEVDPALAHQPVIVPSKRQLLEKAQTFTLDNGMEVVLLPYDTLPIVNARLVFNVGSAHEDPGKSGIASVAASMLRPVQSLQGSPMDRVGISHWTQTSADETHFVAQGMNIYLHVALKGLERLVKAGTYNQVAIEAMRKRVGYQFQSKRYRAQYEMRRQAMIALYGESHPYAMTGPMTPKSAKRIDRDAVDGFREKHYSAGNATLIVAGDFDPVRARKLIKSSFGAWGKGHQDKLVKTPAKPSPNRYIGIVGPDGPNVRVTMAYPAGLGIDSKFAARRYIGNILNQRVADVREKLGSSYGVYGSWQPRVGPSGYFISGPVDKLRVGESINVIRENIADLRKGLDFDEQFVRARGVLIQKSLGKSTVTSTVTGELAFHELHGLPKNFQGKLLKDTAQMAPQTVKAVIAEELDPKSEVIILMGPKDAVEKGFADAAVTNYKLVTPSIQD